MTLEVIRCDPQSSVADEDEDDGGDDDGEE